MKNYYSQINQRFYIIIALMLDDVEYKDMIIDFIFEQGGRSGLENMIQAYSLIGGDETAIMYINQLFLLSEALVYPSGEYFQKIELEINQNNRIMKLIQGSSKKDWIEKNEDREMIFSKDQKIKIKWSDTERNYPITEDWATCHPDKNAYKVDYLITYNEVSIFNFSLVYVDGFRALLPFPKNGTNVIQRKKYKLSLLFNEKKNLHDYIRSSGLVVE